MKKLVFLVIVLVGCALSPIFATPPLPTPKDTLKSPSPTSTLIVYYFHTDTRCRTCHMLEEYAQEAIKTYFATEMETKQMIWQVINVDRDENKHFINDFQLYTKAIILEKKQNGKTTWKNLDKIWDYVSDKDKYSHYIKDEIHAFLGN